MTNTFRIRRLKKIYLIPILFLFAGSVVAQNHFNTDSLKAIVNENKEDTNTYNALMNLVLAVYYDSGDYKKAILYAQQALAIAKKTGDQKREANSMLAIGSMVVDYIQGVQMLTSALSIYEALKDSENICMVKLPLQATYREAGDFRNALYQALTGVEIAAARHIKGDSRTFPGHLLEPLFLSEIGQTYILMKQPDSALIYVKKAIALHEKFNGAIYEFPFYLLATIQM